MLALETGDCQLVFARLAFASRAGQRGGAPRELVAGNRSEFLPERARVAWRLEANTWQGRNTPRMVLEALEQV